MTDNQDQINQLLEKLDALMKRQNDFLREINTLRIEIDRLKNNETEQKVNKEPEQDRLASTKMLKLKRHRNDCLSRPPTNTAKTGIYKTNSPTGQETA